MKNKVFTIKSFVLFSFFHLFLSHQLVGQTIKSAIPPPKVIFGVHSLREIDMTSSYLDSTAVAAVLFDKADIFYDRNNGETNIKADIFYDRNNGETNITVHRRVKIFKNQNLDIQSFLGYEYPHAIDGGLQMHKLEGFVYNFDPTKKQIVTTPINPKSVVVQNTSNGNIRTHIVPADLKDGSVIEFKFVLTGYGVWGWDHNFQFNVPTHWSEVHYQLPRNHEYKADLKNTKVGKLAYQEVNGVTIHSGGAAIDKNADLYINVAYADIPALNEEPYDYSSNRYRLYLEMGFPKREYTGGVEQDGKALYKNLQYEKLYKSYPVIKEIAVNLMNSITDKSDTVACMRAAVEWVKKNISLNNTYPSLSPLKENLAYIIKEKKGNYNELNYVLFNLVREMGFKEAGLALLKPREEGGVYDSGVVTDCRYVVVFMIFGGKEQYIDAANINTRIGLLDPDLINNKAMYILTEKESALKDCNISDKYQKVVQIETTINAAEEKTTFTGKVIAGGYYALSIRDKITEESEEKYKNNFKTAIAELNITEVKFDGVSNLDKSMEAAITGDANTITTFTEGRIFVKPSVGIFEKNPFTAAVRNNPIDFVKAIAYTTNHNIKIPAGYVIESLPKSESIGLPNSEGKFTYTAEEKDGLAKISVRLNINQPIFGVEKYESVQRFFEALTKKVSEEVIFKKQ